MYNFNDTFYPTPINLIHKMLGKLDFRYIKSVLEPSGGKGDLLDAITKQFSYNSRKDKKTYDIDTIEIDENLQHILKGKGYRLVHDDYLTYQSYKRYDAIIANFPFSQGDKHLLKAIEMQSKGGEIVALINVETLNNPYTNTRKELAQKLEDLNADIEYIESAFINSERSTNVTVALIHISMPKNDYNSVILDELKKEELQESTKEYNSRELVDSDFIKGIVQQYNYEIKAGLRLIDEYNSLKPLMLDSFKDNSSSVLKLEINGHNDHSESLENSYIKQIRSKYWKTLFTNEQFIGLFTSNLRQKYLEQIEELKNYDFSLYNIYSLRSQLSQEMIQGVEDTILNLFEEFSHKHYYDETSKNIHLYNGWKTNKSYKVNKKVIIPLNGFNGWFDGSYRPTDYRVLDKLKDMEKVFNYLDGGLTEEIDITDTLKMAEHYQESRKIDLKYFFITFYKKGTCHIEFKNEELLHKFNLYAAKSKMWLPPSYGNVKYKDMTSEEKEAIDQFEGEKSYNKVVNNKAYYIVDSGELLKLTEGSQKAV